MTRGQAYSIDNRHPPAGSSELSFSFLEPIDSPTEGIHHRQQRHKKHRKHSRKNIAKYGIDKDVTASDKQTDARGDVINTDTMKLKINVTPKLSFKARDDFELPDFSWLTKDYTISAITDPFDQANENEYTSNGDCLCANSSNNDHDSSCLSQRDAPLPSISVRDQVTMSEREAIEEEIKKKYAEMEELMDQINANKRTRTKRRRNYKLRKYDQERNASGDEWVPSYVNICPIKRRKRPAQPIRNAVLIRTALKKAWRGALGSCCGKGCWATWRWINLGHVISDYE